MSNLSEYRLSETSQPKITVQNRLDISEQAKPDLSINDAFSKAYAFTRADDAIAAGIHPFFQSIEAQDGGMVRVDGQDLIVTGSNDYLGLTQDARIKQAARDALNDFGTSCTGSRFLTGTLSFHNVLESRLASFLNKESALTFSAGFLGCLSVISSLAGRHDTLYFDRENHACLYDGARLSFGTLKKYQHNDMADLERLLERDTNGSGSKPGGKMIVTDGVFSMSGHIANLPEIVALAKKYNARVLVDDAHAVGVLGDNGRGTAEYYGLEDDVDLILGTFSKSFASVGGYVAGDYKVVNWIKHTARPFIFTAALPAMQMAAALKALDIVETEPQLREQLWKNVHTLQSGMQALGYDTLGTQSPIVPVFVGDDDMALALWKCLRDLGVFTTPSIPPAVAPNESIIRTSINANHQPEHIEGILNAFEKAGKMLGIIG